MKKECLRGGFPTVARTAWMSFNDDGAALGLLAVDPLEATAKLRQGGESAMAARCTQFSRGLHGYGPITLSG